MRGGRLPPLPLPLCHGQSGSAGTNLPLPVTVAEPGEKQEWHAVRGGRQRWKKKKKKKNA